MSRSRRRSVDSVRWATRGSVRRRRVRERFDLSVDRERRRYSGDAWRILVGELRVRFLERHLSTGPGWVLELGPGTGRFTPTVLASGSRVVAADLSLPMLRALGRHAPVQARRHRLARVRAAGEHLPFRNGTFRAAVAYGNILCFAAKDGEHLLAELARVVRPGGCLILDVASPVGATIEFLTIASQRRILHRILRDPEYYFLNAVVGKKERAHQPFDPDRMAYWEFDFYTPAAAEAALAEAGFRTVDRMAVAPLGAYRDRVTTIARRDRRAWTTLVELEERVGRRSGALETGHGFVMAAVRGPSRARRRSRN